MIDHLFKEIPFSKHPLYALLKNDILLYSHTQLVLDILENYTTFIYPKTLSFSFGHHCFQGIKDDVRRFNIEDQVLMSEGQKDNSQYISRKCFIDFFLELSLIFERLKFNPILVFDLFTTRFFDQSSIMDVIDILDGHSMKFNILLLIPYNIKNYIDESTYIQKSSVFFSKDSLLKYLYNYVLKPENILTVTFKGIVTLKSLDKFFESIDFYSNIYNKFIIEFDFNNVIKFNSHSLFLISLIIHSLSHQFGIVSRIKIDSAKNNVISLLNTFRIFKINQYFLFDEKVSDIKFDYDKPVFGIYLFDKSFFRQTIDKFENFIYFLARTFTYDLDHRFSYKYDFPGGTRKGAIFRAKLKEIIISIVGELVENVIQHSEGVGYIGAHVQKGNLFLFIGDCGIGIKSGILKNYEMADEIIDDEDAIKYCFKLHQFDKKRKKVSLLEEGPGRGLRDTFNNISICNGKFFLRTMNCLGSFVNPILKGHMPTDIIKSYLKIIGTQYLLAIPLKIGGETWLPNTTADFLDIGV